MEDIPLLKDFQWKATYKSNHGNLVRDFLIPQLEEINDFVDDLRHFYPDFDNLTMLVITPMVSQKLIDRPKVLNSYLYREELMRIAYYIGRSLKGLRFYEKAEKMYLKALNNNEKLKNTKSEIHLDFRAKISSDLGYLYREFRRLNKSITIFKEVLEINKELEKKDPKKYQPFVLKTEKILEELAEELSREYL